jgi:hypothetical protein
VVVCQDGKKGEHRLWLCRCDCGQEKRSIGRNLTKGYTQSCGCRKTRSRAVNAGQKYGRLTALRRAGWLGGEPAFLFRCDCGVEKVIGAQSVRRGVAKSCGCFRKEWAKHHGATHQGPGRDGKAYLRYYRKNYFYRAKKHGIVFNLDLDKFERLALSPCFYCGAPPASTEDSRYGSYPVNGIDRKDSGGGYTLENCVPCCKRCNYGKNALSVAEFKQWIERVHRYFVAP